MSLSRPLIALVGVGVLGIAAVGAGVGATFTDATHSLQTINTGSIDMRLSSTDTSVSGSGSKTLTLAKSDLNGSTFKTDLVPITMKNIGTGTAKKTTIEVTDDLTSGSSSADVALRDQMFVCILSPADNSGTVIYDGLVKDVGLKALTGTVGPGATDTYSAEFYAGAQATACSAKSGEATPVLTGLNNDAQGGSFTPNVTVNFVE